MLYGTSAAQSRNPEIVAAQKKFRRERERHSSRRRSRQQIRRSVWQKIRNIKIRRPVPSNISPSHSGAAYVEEAARHTRPSPVIPITEEKRSKLTDAIFITSCIPLSTVILVVPIYGVMEWQNSGLVKLTSKGPIGRNYWSAGFKND